MTEEKHTYCRICEVYCGLVATVEDGKITKLRPDKDHVVSKGKVHLWNDALDGEVARLAQVTATPADAAYPLRLIGRRDLRSNNSWLHNVPRLMRGERCHRLRIHPEDATRLGLHDGDPAVVRSTVGEVNVDVRVTDEVMPGVVSLPHGWGHTYETNRQVVRTDPGPNCNALIDHRVIEPLAGMAFLNGFPVAVERREDRRVVNA